MIASFLLLGAGSASMAEAYEEPAAGLPA